MQNKSSISIFDTNIFLTGIDFNLFDGLIYTTPTIIEEIKVKRYLKKNRNILYKIQAALENQKLIIRPPKKKYIQEVIIKSKVTGDYSALSEADKELIALALELTEIDEYKVKFFSNDYSIENVSFELQIPFFPLFKQGIKSKILWEVYCPHCKNAHNVEDLHKNCEICGSIMKRRPKSNKIY